MKCTKCNGWMCIERFSDFHAMLDIWRCVNCGARIDEIILENRRNPSRFKSEVDVSVAVEEEEEAFSI